MKFSRTAFKCLLLTGVAVAFLTGASTAHGEDCDTCPKMDQPGKAAMVSRVIKRSVPPTTEYRRPADEIAVLWREKPETSKQDNVLYFASGQHRLSEAGEKSLTEFAAGLQGGEIERAEIVGHADKQPLSEESRKYYADNHALSIARAEAVTAYLKELPGWQDVPINITGMGDSEASVKCRLDMTAEAAKKAYQDCIADNRRVELRIWYKTTISAAPETGICKDAPAQDSDLPFRISVDGEVEDGKDSPNSADVTRCTDVALERANVQLRFDGLEVEPALNVTVYPEGALRGEDIRFIPYTNYLAFIQKAELRIFKAGASTQKKPLAVLPVDQAWGAVVWGAPQNQDITAVQYVLRVYDAKGRFDETTPKRLEFLDKRRPAQKAESREREELIGYGENHIGLRNIPVNGGTVTVNGYGVAAGETVKVMGQKVPVDTQGKFAIKQILPAGSHRIDIVREKTDGARTEFNRNILIPSADWFYVGIADLTVGLNNTKGPAALVTGNNSGRYNNKVYQDGRLAYYVKGKVNSGWEVTSSADTGEKPLKELFRNFDEKDSRSLLRRLDPSAHYAVYGDDSTLIEDAPTLGKFYVKMEKDDTKALWGNFQTRMTGTDLMNFSRTLYGAEMRHGSMSTTSLGEKRTELNLFAADPGTLDAIEEFRGTGGSLYYLRNQDIVIGSERLRVEVRDQDSGIVLQSKTLIFGQDYDINYLQGRVILSTPLESTAGISAFILNGTQGGNPVYLVAGYEFTPGVSSVNNMTKGGRASHWLNEHLRLGVSGYEQKGTGRQQTLLGADMILRYKPGTYLKLETARSDGPGTGSMSSQNGGFNFGTIPQTGTAGINADAHRVEIAADFAELTGDRQGGALSGYWLNRQNGFSAPGQLTNEGIEQLGGMLRLPVSDRLDFKAKADFKEGKTSGSYKAVEAGVDYAVSPVATLTLGARHDNRDTALAAGGSALLAQTGRRTDAIAKLAYTPHAEDGGQGRYEIYGLGQMTLQRDAARFGNNRFGGGGRYRINDRLQVTGELTGGNGGLGSKAGVEYQVNDRTSHYINYLADTGRTDTGINGRSNTLVAGTRSRYSDSLSTFSEQRYMHASQGPSGVMHAMGLDFAANDRWTFGGQFETGKTSDRVTGDLERVAASVSAGYVRDKVKYGGALEWRDESGNTTGDRTSWLMRNTLAYQVSEDWRFAGGLDFAISDAGTGSTTDAHFTELNMGFAYRPVLNDRLNALVRYTYLSDEGSPGQVSGTGVVNGYEQRSHVFSGDFIYDVLPKLSLGGKLGYRVGELRDATAEGAPWFSSTAWLGVARADWHVVHEWDVTAEWRYLNAKDAGDAKAGALVGVYRHLNDNVKFGVGYNFTDFSDDLTNLDYRSQGLFFNVVGRF